MSAARAWLVCIEWREGWGDLEEWCGGRGMDGLEVWEQ